jgi:hypothetical protein
MVNKNHLFFFMLIVFLCACQKQNPNLPSKGQWDFQPTKVWEIHSSEKHPFDRIAEPLVTKDGYLYVRDFKNNISFIFNSDGKFEGKFAKQGDQPGELSRYINRFSANGQVVIGSPDKLHFFSKDGKFIRSVPNNLFQRFPLLFLNENEFLYGSNQMSDLPPNIARIYRFNPEVEEEKLFAELSIPNVDTLQKSSKMMLFIHGLTPAVVLGFDEKNQTFYYGRSDCYQINSSNLKGEQLKTFGLDRDKTPINEAEIKNHFKAFNWTEERINSIIKDLPKELTFFHRIQVINGLLYVWNVHGIPQKQSIQKIDIFSPDGKYLYQADLKFDNTITFSQVDKLVLSENSLIGIFEDENSNSKIIKYEVKIPNL